MKLKASYTIFIMAAILQLSCCVCGIGIERIDGLPKGKYQFRVTPEGKTAYVLDINNVLQVDMIEYSNLEDGIPPISADPRALMLICWDDAFDLISARDGTLYKEIVPANEISRLCLVSANWLTTRTIVTTWDRRVPKSIVFDIESEQVLFYSETTNVVSDSHGENFASLYNKHWYFARIRSLGLARGDGDCTDAEPVFLRYNKQLVYPKVISGSSQSILDLTSNNADWLAYCTSAESKRRYITAATFIAETETVCFLDPHYHEERPPPGQTTGTIETERYPTTATLVLLDGHLIQEDPPLPEHLSIRKIPTQPVYISYEDFATECFPKWIPEDSSVEFRLPGREDNLLLKKIFFSLPSLDVVREENLGPPPQERLLY